MRFELTRVTPIDFESIALTARPSCQTAGYTPHHATNTNTNSNTNNKQHTNTPTHQHTHTHTNTPTHQHTNIHTPQRHAHKPPRISTHQHKNTPTTMNTLVRGRVTGLHVAQHDVPADQSISSPARPQPRLGLPEMDMDSDLAWRLLDRRKEEKRQNRKRGALHAVERIGAQSSCVFVISTET